jgi:hypothetical protein
MDEGFTLTVSGLLRKRAEIAGQIESLQSQLGQMLANLDHLDASIRVFAPEIENLPVKAVAPPNAAFRGEVSRFLLDQLRAADGEPLTTFELAEAIMAARHLNRQDRTLFILISKRTGHSLTKLRRAGHVVSERVSDRGLLAWRLSSDSRVKP